MDFDVLKSVAEHPQLTKPGKRSNFAASQFSTAISKREYLWHTALQLRDIKGNRNLRPPLDSPDAELNGLVELMTDCPKAWSQEATEVTVWRIYCNSHFSNEGYEKFQQHAKRQANTLSDSEFWQVVRIKP